MPGPPAPFTDTTIMLLYGPPNQGKTTFAHFLSQSNHPILLLDPICISICNAHKDSLQPFLVPSKSINHQLGSLLRKLSEHNSKTLLKGMIDEIFVMICNQLQEHTKKHRFVIIEGYLLCALPSLCERLILHITQNKWRHWICHK